MGRKPVTRNVSITSATIQATPLALPEVRWQDFPDFMRRLRRRRGLSQQRLSELLGRDRTYICKLERAQSWPSAVFLLNFLQTGQTDILASRRKKQTRSAPLRYFVCSSKQATDNRVPCPLRREGDRGLGIYRDQTVASIAVILPLRRIAIFNAVSCARSSAPSGSGASGATSP